MDQATFKALCRMAHDRAGITLQPGKESLVSARVAKRQRALGIADVKDYLRYLESDRSGHELVQFLDVISTNFTSFMREPDHFELLTTHSGKWLAKGQRRFRIWSAASSTGEEPYTIAITLAQVFDGHSVDYRILATDISTTVLERAAKGVYPEARLGPLSKKQRLKYFDRQGKRGEEDPLFEVKPEIRQRVVFKRLNLSKPPFPMKGPLDFVFCRNVMIYFDHEVRQRLVSAIEGLLRPGGV